MWLMNRLNNVNNSNESNFMFIEFGCGRGWFVDFMKRQNLIMSAIGFDPGEISVKL